MNTYYTLFTIILVAIVVEPHFMRWVHLQVIRGELFFQKTVFMIKLRWDMYSIRQGWHDKKYLRMVEEIMANE
jgi:hypothetical protein